MKQLIINIPYVLLPCRLNINYKLLPIFNEQIKINKKKARATQRNTYTGDSHDDLSKMPLHCISHKSQRQ